jgi:hypothetical protein
MFLRKDINYGESAKIMKKFDALKYKIYIFTAFIVNPLTMYSNTNQAFTTKQNLQ